MHPLRFPNSGIRAKALPAGEGRPHACCMHAEVAGHGQAPYKGHRPWPSYLQGATARRGDSPQGAATRGHGRLWLAHKGLPPVASPAAILQGGHPLAGRLPAAKGNRCLHRGSGSDGAVRVKEGYGIFLRKR
ncbi:hypothetical protein B296_00027717 [Ensete ventricosum]|uniref:Uncharacterized protein n=1 Tax=Ensete ventricosum TaxID=4639 RepID=A0A426ZB23_ENSVE|nr:hypothetical protein B296_00027717 [Ensete ventricosum]